ncbi:MAG: hypothetical protein LBQ38_01320 [Spirochaetaceae bacterium]|jgi:hypothetical protein|nr:hypothetical protein [Spirochaetaceae bacterium]
MKILQIKDIERKDVPIYYRRLFTGLVVLELLNKEVERHIDFSIETKPTGHKEISITLADSVDYPLVPLIKELKKYVNDLDDAGGLPG